MLTATSTMSELLQEFPGAQRALFARYHIGGCQSCGFSPNETIGDVCQRNENLDPAEVIEHVRTSHEADAKIQISPQELVLLRQANPALLVLDARTREEHEAVKLEGSQLITQDLIQTIFGSGDKSQPIVIYDHMGTRSLDAAAYFIGHGFSETKCLAGGINAYSIEVDPTLPRYYVELE